ncbi:sulfate reduction electron transfer complex DsrMKJOP subunit DsrP [Thermodesulfatator autotrophicus]|uniref:Menaquinol oxidoreductase n=1 Tax=Thermodesulfatator autotrophicus TaxID=1795632 RepID=A0A177E834_9BACT|nr:NrfD/PsrC family molybdoenzyme membrane anchor subunit [Thermodesulfatator autotrophicus]OAG27856.1 menaquinol oxidoreductase [Thermodesulfatator autotrophicus]
MFEKALVGSKKYYALVFFLASLFLIGLICFIYQMKVGLGITGMSRDVSWGFYIAQFTYLVGIAASGVMVVLPYYLHNYKEYARLVIFGEFMAIAAVIMCILFILVDIGQTHRVMNVALHPTPNSVMFYDMIVLCGYLMLNIICGWTALSAMYKGTKYPKWVKPFIYLSIPWAFSIHTVTAFLYAGMPDRHLWLTAVMAPRFLASAFCSGPALLLILLYIVKTFTKFDPGEKAIKALAKTITYALIANLFLFGCELFTAFYSGIPAHQHSLIYLFAGLEGHNKLVPWMWTAYACMVIAAILLVIPQVRNNLQLLPFLCLLVVIGTWIDKGMGLVIGGFIPNPLHEITEYMPTLPEVMISVGIWALGFLIVTVLYKMVISVMESRRLI